MNWNSNINKDNANLKVCPTFYLFVGQGRHSSWRISLASERQSVGQGFSLASERQSVGQGFPLEPMVLTEPEVSLASERQTVGQGFSLAKKPRYKKRVRLREFDYKGDYRYFVTICTYNKRNILCDSSIVSWLLDVLKEKSKLFRFKVWAYCFMPNHLHLLIEGEEDGSDMIKFITSFKQDTGFHYKRRFGHRLWQVNFYEHVLRKEEATEAVANYIFNNPVRKGLVDDYKKYQFLGSFEYDVMQT